MTEQKTIRRKKANYADIDHAWHNVKSHENVTYAQLVRAWENSRSYFFEIIKGKPGIRS